MEADNSSLAVETDEKASVPGKKPPRSERKRRRHEELLAEKRENRKRKKMERKERMRAETSVRAEGVSKKEEKSLIKERLQEALTSGQKICIDCSLEDHMSEKEKGKLAMQIGRAYGSNRHAAQPVHLCLTGLDKTGTLYEQCRKKNDGFINYVQIAEQAKAQENQTIYNIGVLLPYTKFEKKKPPNYRFQIDVHELPHTSVFPHDQIVYLTPDSDSPLTDIDKDKIYIIGGLVDESVTKNITKEKAIENGTKTARLPIDEYMQKIPQESHSKVLAVNQVFDILLTYINTKNWKKALLVGVPKRKGYVISDIQDT